MELPLQKDAIRNGEFRSHVQQHDEKKLFVGCSYEENYVDDILEQNDTFENHLAILRLILDWIRKAGLTIRPSKCLIGFSIIGFTGHTVGNGIVEIEEEKVERIKEPEIPKTKKEVRAFLWLACLLQEVHPLVCRSRNTPWQTWQRRNNQIKWSGALPLLEHPTHRKRNLCGHR